jgi:serine O-acetyltransferase
MPAMQPPEAGPRLRETLRTDLTAYYPAVWLCERGIWALLVFRIAQWIRARYGERIASLPRALRLVLSASGLLVFRFTEVLTGIELPSGVEVGPRLRIWHGGNIVINPGVVIGSDCVLRQGVTIGNLDTDGPVPRLGNRVNVGAYAQILGEVTIGDDARVGALSVVLQDVPPGATAVGVPARIIERI